jgi:glycosyltransferase involved in cell wall biosynthesis
VQTADEKCNEDVAAGPERAAGRHIAIFLSGVDVGGVQRTMLTLARALAARGHRIDLVLPNAQGPFRALIPKGIRVIDLENWWLRLPFIRRRKRSRVLASPPLIARYLRAEKPDLLLSASHYVNIAALVGRRLSGLDAPLVISQRTHLTRAIANGPLPGVRRPTLGPMVRRFYPWADAVVAVSDGVADDTAVVTRLPRGAIRTIYNPADTLDIARQARLPVDHPWFQPGGPPVILGVGRLAAQKDFPTLLRAFAQVREQHDARLVILGEGRQRAMLEALVGARGRVRTLLPLRRTSRSADPGPCLRLPRGQHRLSERTP